MVRKTRNPPGRRERRRAAVTERILAAALEILRQEGLEGLTLKRLAARTDYAVGSLYRYFPGKGAVLAAVEARLIAHLRADLASALERVDRRRARRRQEESSATLLRLLVAGRVYEAQERLRPVEFGLLSRTLGDTRAFVEPEAFAPVEPELRALLATVAELFGAAQRAGQLSRGDRRQRTTAYWAGLHGALRVRKLRRFGLDDLGLEDVPSQVLRGLLMAWGADGTRLRGLDRRAKRIVAAALPLPG